MRSSIKDPAGVPGLGPALRRLESAELAAYTRLQRAIGGPDEGPARKSWLAISEQLRRSDLALEQNRRDAGELVPRAEGELAIEATSRMFCIGARQILLAFSERLRPMPDRELLATELHRCLSTWAGTVGAFATGAHQLPSWASEAFQRGTSAGLQPAMPSETWVELCAFAAGRKAEATK